MLRTMRAQPGWRVAHRALLKRISLCAVGVLTYAGATAWSDAMAREQFNSKTWTTADGAPSDVSALTQSRDGTLWIGTGVGLFRFDGVKLERYPQPGDMPLSSPNISALTASGDGTLWIGFRFGGVASLRDGHLVTYDERDGLPDGTVKALVWGHDGSLWAAARGGLARLDNKRWVHVEKEAIPTTYGAVVDHEGTLWVATEDQVLARAIHSGSFRVMAKRTGTSQKTEPIAVAPDGSVWTVTDDGLTRLVLAPKDSSEANQTFHTKVDLPLLFDRNGNLWSGGDTAHLLRMRDQLADPVAEPLDELTGALHGKGVQTFFQDREGNVWMGSGSGLARFTRSSVARVLLPPCVDWGYALAVGVTGTLLVACANPHVTSGVTEIRNGGAPGTLSMPTFTAAFRDSDGSVWLGGVQGIAHLLEGGQIVTTAVPQEASHAEIQAIARDRTGALWVSIVRKGLFRFFDGRWYAYGGVEQLPRLPAIVATVEHGGALWLGYTDNRVARIDGAAVRLFAAKDGLSVGNVTAIAASAGHIWVSGELGLALFDRGRFVPVVSVSGDPFPGITGIIETSAGDLWLNGDAGIVHVSRDDVARLLRVPDFRVPDFKVRARIFNALDGVLGTAQALRPIPSAVETPDGRLWFQTTAGLVLIDTTRNVYNALAPPVTIGSIRSNGVRHPASTDNLTLPPGTRSVQIDYTAGSLSVPERVGFRYKLAGVDREWQDPGSRREAFYTNLDPGDYTFHVVASNSDGVWNTTGASVRFTILPTFYQTTWFHALCVLACLALLTVLYRMRALQISTQVRSRLEARLAERERIARELHDTLLQGVQGLILRFQAAADIISERDPAREAMERTLERADDLLDESRARVMDLRDPASGLVALQEALAAEGEQLAAAYPGEFSVSAEGLPRALHPIVREETLLLGREALVNAFRHAQATRIEVEVYYGDTGLRMRVRDNGCGIDPAVLAKGGPRGHWGLSGMRERAKTLSARLDIWSTAGGGTEIDLRVPATVAYSESWRPTRRPWWRRTDQSLLKEFP
jgi:signal transduction histidine kinase/ligand-binding sensor domain-containing protein